jgi:HEAT repeat protein
VARSDTALSRLFEARARGDTAYLIESLRLEPEHAGLAAEWLADEGVGEAAPALTRLLDVADPNARVAAIKALERLGPPDEGWLFLQLSGPYSADGATHAVAYSAFATRVEELIKADVDHYLTEVAVEREKQKEAP